MKTFPLLILMLVSASCKPSEESSLTAFSSGEQRFLELCNDPATRVDYRVTIEAYRKSKTKKFANPTCEEAVLELKSLLDYTISIPKQYGRDMTTLEPLHLLDRVQKIAVDGSKISDLNPIRDLRLTALAITGASVQDISPITGIETLAAVDFRSNEISDISPLSTLPQLHTLVLMNNPIVDFSTINSLNNLEILAVGDNQEVDISSFSRAKSITSLRIHNTRIKGIDSLSAFTSLSDLAMVGCNLRDTAWARALTNFENLSVLQLPENHISGPLTGLEKLKNLVDLDLSRNEVNDLQGLAGLKLLEVLDVSSNLITDITPIQFAPIKSLLISDNPLGTTVTRQPDNCPTASSVSPAVRGFCSN